jgi:hypothetical protein
VDVNDCTGATGSQGPPGPPAAVLWAVVESDGTLVRSSNAVAATDQPGFGQYTVTFNQNVRACVYIATLGLTGSAFTAPPGSITVVGEGMDVNGVWISTYDGRLLVVTNSIRLMINCPSTVGLSRQVCP